MPRTVTIKPTYGKGVNCKSNEYNALRSNSRIHDGLR